MNTFNLTLDLAKAKERQQQTIFLRQGDRNATTIVATITDHGVAASTSGLTARFSMRLPNGTEYYRKAASLSGSTATVTIDETQAASVVGRTDTAYFQLLQGSTVVASTESFTVIVLPDALADATVPETYDSAIQDAIGALDAAVADMPDMVETVLADHPEWTTTVQDGSITEAKLADDLARDRERLLYRLANLLTVTLPEGETATATDAARTPMAALALYGRSTQDGTPAPSAPVAIQSVTPQLLPNHPQKMDTNKGITFTDNGDGSYGISGTATANAYIYLTNNDTGLKLPAGTYTLSARDGNDAPVTGVRVGASRWVNGTNTNYGLAVGSFTFTHTGEGNVQLIVEIAKNNTVNATIWPCLYAGSTAYPFVPYGNAGLWARRTSDASTYTVTLIPLDGHELRSLPDGTRDEVAVDARGHAVLVQRVGSVTLDGSSDEVWSQRVPNSGDYLMKGFGGAEFNAIVGNPIAGGHPARCTRLAWHESGVFSNMPDNAFMLGAASLSGSTNFLVVRVNAYTTLASFKAWLAANPMTLDYPLATPQTIDLGTIDPVPLVGPDLTAQAVPTAPMQLTYERDLNATLARLESAIANLV